MKAVIGRILRFIDVKHMKKVDKFMAKYIDDDAALEYLIKKMAYDLPLEEYNDIVKKSIQTALYEDNNQEYYEMMYKFKHIIKFKLLRLFGL